MEIIKKIFITLLLVVFSFFICSAIYIRFQGKTLLKQALKQTFPSVTIQDISYHFPFSFQIQNLRVKDVFQSERVDVQFDLGSILSREINIASLHLYKPVLNIIKEKYLVKGDRGRGNKGDAFFKKGSFAAPEALQNNQQEESFFSLAVDHLTASQAEIHYQEHLEDDKFSFGLTNVQLNVRNLSFPLKPESTEFQVVGQLSKPGNPLNGSQVKADGWVNIVKRDMKVSFEVVEETGFVALKAEAVSENNDMFVQGDATFKNFFSELQDQNGEKEDALILDVVSGILSSLGVEIGTKFSFRTKMDDFQIRNISLAGNISAQVDEIGPNLLFP